MSIQKRDTAAGVRYVARYRGPDKKERSKSFERRKDAKAWIEERERDMRRGEWIDPAKGATTVAQLVARWEQAATRSNTRRARTQLARNLGPFGDLPIHAFGSAELRAWNRTLTEGRPWKGGTALSQSTVATMRGQLLGALEMARENGELRSVPQVKTLGSVRRLAVSPKEIPTVEHVERLVDVSSQDGSYIDAHGVQKVRRARPQTGVLIEVAAGTGMRANELLGLRPMDVDFLRREIHPTMQSAGGAKWEWVPLKTERSRRVIPVTGRTIELLSAELAAHPVDEDGPIFRTKTGAMVQYPLLQNSLAMCRHDADVPDWVTLHSLRHHYASRLIAAGVPVSAVSAALGHSTPSTTLDTYTHLWPGSDDLVRAALANRGQNAGYLRDGGA